MTEEEMLEIVRAYEEEHPNGEDFDDEEFVDVESDASRGGDLELESKSPREKLEAESDTAQPREGEPPAPQSRAGSVAEASNGTQASKGVLKPTGLGGPPKNMGGPSKSKIKKFDRAVEMFREIKKYKQLNAELEGKVEEVRKTRQQGKQKKSDLYVFTKAKDLAKYILTVTEKSPKKFRFTLVVRLQNYILDVLERLYFANTLPLGAERRAEQERAKHKLSMLDYYAGLSYEVTCITFKQYEQISMQTAECLMYLGKWIASDARRVQTQEQGLA